MIDFACKQFRLDDIFICSFGFTKTDYFIFNYLTQHTNQRFTSEELAKRVHRDQSTVQRSLKKMHDEFLVKRLQENLTSGGYIYHYTIESKQQIRSKVLVKVKKWTSHIERSLNIW